MGARVTNKQPGTPQDDALASALEARADEVNASARPADYLELANIEEEADRSAPLDVATRDALEHRAVRAAGQDTEALAETLAHIDRLAKR